MRISFITNLNMKSYVGDIDNNGHLYLKSPSTSLVSVIDLDPESKTYLTKIRDFSLSSNIPIADWAFNPEDNKLYTLSRDLKLYKIDPNTGAFLYQTSLQIDSGGGVFGATFFDKNGFLYAYKNYTGEI